MVIRYKIKDTISIYKNIKSNGIFIFDIEKGQVIAKANLFGKIILYNIENKNLGKLIKNFKYKENEIRFFISQLVKNRIIKIIR